MREFLAAALIFCASVSEAQEMKPADLKRALESDWSVIRASHYHFMGDFDMEYPVIFFQRLPDKRLLVSRATQRRWARLIPEPLRYIDSEEWEKIAEQLIAHYSTAFTSDPESQIRRHAMGADLHSIEISVTGLDTKQFSHRFSLSDESWQRFSEFLEGMGETP
jgi:hypothetical protein